jgi:WD40 repeat protein
MSVFRDQTNLSASPHLWQSIENALRSAEFFILLASVEAASSKWVKREVEFWLTHRSPDTLLLAITDGAVEWDSALGDFDWRSTTALPTSLVKAFAGEPQFIDFRFARTSEDLSLRNPMFIERIVDISATLLRRPKDEIVGEDIRQHHRTRRVIVAVIASLSGLTGIATYQRNQAVYEREIAVARQLAAQALLMRNDSDQQFLRLALTAEAVKRLTAIDADSQTIDMALREEIAAIPRHRVRVTPKPGQSEVFLSRDGGQLLVRSLTALDAGVYSAMTGREQVRFEASTKGEFKVLRGDKVLQMQVEDAGDESRIAAVSSDNRYVVTETGHGYLSKGVKQVWDIESGKEIFRLSLATSGSCQLSTDGRYLAAFTHKQNGSGYKTVVWDVHAARQISGDASGSLLALSDAGDVLATSDGLWSVADRLVLLSRWSTDVSEAVLTADGRYAAIIAERDGVRQIEVWSTETGSVKSTQRMRTDAGSLLALAPGGTVVVVDTGRTELRDMTAKDVLDTGVIVAWTTVSTNAVSVSESGEYRVASSLESDNAVDIWTLGREGGSALALTQEYFPPMEPAVAVGLTPAGGVMTVSELGGRLTVATGDVHSGETRERVRLPGRFAAFAPDGRTFAVAGDSSVDVRGAGVQSPVATLPYAKADRVVWSPNGRELGAYGRFDDQVRVWDVRSGHSWALPVLGWPKAIALDASGELLAAVTVSKLTGSDQVHTASLWSLSTSQKIRTFEIKREQGIGGEPYCALSPDARFVVTLNLSLIDMKTGTSRLALGTDQFARRCVFNTDGHLLAAAVSSGLRLFDLESGRQVLSIPTADAPLAFDEESRYLATMGEDHTVRVWPLRREDLTEQACERLPRNLSLAEWREYIGVESYRKTCPTRP